MKKLSTLLVFVSLIAVQNCLAYTYTVTNRLTSGIKVTIVADGKVETTIGLLPGNTGTFEFEALMSSNGCFESILINDKKYTVINIGNRLCSDMHFAIIDDGYGNIVVTRVG